MEVSIAHSLLSVAVADAARATGGTKINPILTAMLVEVKDDKLILMATDGYQFVRREMAVTLAVEGAALVSAARFASLVAAMSNKVGDVILRLADNELLIKAGRGQYKLTTLDRPELFPEMKSIENLAPMAKVPASVLKRAVELASIGGEATDTSSTASYRQGLQFKGGQGTLHLASTNTQKLSYYRLDGALASDDLNALVPLKNITAILPTLPDASDVMVEIYKSGATLIFKAGGLMASSTLLDLKYPNYLGAIPAKAGASHIVSVAIDDLQGAFKRLKVLTTGDMKELKPLVRFELNDDLLKLTVADVNAPGTGSFEEVSVEVERRGEPLNLLVNIDNVQEVCRAASGNQLQLVFNGKGAVIMLVPTDSSFLYLFMPLVEREGSTEKEEGAEEDG